MEFQRQSISEKMFPEERFTAGTATIGTTRDSNERRGDARCGSRLTRLRQFAILDWSKVIH
jgi:hypothetical protein